MGYTKVGPFVNGGAPPLSAANLDHIETQYDEAVSETDSKVAAAKTVKLDDFSAPDNNTDLDASITKHGLLPKLPGDATKFLSGAGSWVTGAIPLVVRKTADETVNNSDVPQNDDALLLAVGANEIWHIYLLLRITTTAVADFQYTFAIPAGGAMKHFDIGIIGACTTTAKLQSATDSTGTIPLLIPGAVTDYWYMFWAVYVGGANAGNIQLQWAQYTAEATDTKVLANSFITAHRLA